MNDQSESAVILIGFVCNTSTNWVRESLAGLNLIFLFVSSSVTSYEENVLRLILKNQVKTVLIRISGDENGSEILGLFKLISAIKLYCSEIKVLTIKHGFVEFNKPKSRQADVDGNIELFTEGNILRGFVERQISQDSAKAVLSDEQITKIQNRLAVLEKAKTKWQTIDKYFAVVGSVLDMIWYGFWILLVFGLIFIIFTS
ncbi:MAG: hypothetical protein WCT08_02555 [Patescibacteria group bacterium]|jgi:hypothetical protein